MSSPPPLPVHNPYAAPQARVDHVVGEELILASRGLRLGAAILDSLTLVVPIALFGIVAAVVVPLMSPTSGGGEPNEVVMGIMGVLMSGVFITVIVVNLLWLHRYGQTIAKRWLKIKVVRTDGSRCALSRIVFARWLPVTLLSAIPLLGYAVSLADSLFIFRDDRRCLHDLIADTIVIAA